MNRTVNAFIITTVCFLGVVSAAATSKEFSLLGHTLNARTLYAGYRGNMRFYLSSLEAVIPGSIGTAPSSVFALYHHAMALLDSSSETKPIKLHFWFQLWSSVLQYGDYQQLAYTLGYSTRICTENV